MLALHWLARGGLTLAVLLTVAVIPGGSLLLLSNRVRRAAFGPWQPLLRTCRAGSQTQKTPVIIS
jgi:hypothetical protein